MSAGLAYLVRTFTNPDRDGPRPPGSQEATVTPAPVPLCDIQAQYKALKSELDAAVLRVLGTGQAILGPEVEAFEREAASATGAAFAVGCSSGTDALILALHAVGVGPGDEVI